MTALRAIKSVFSVVGLILFLFTSYSQVNHSVEKYNLPSTSFLAPLGTLYQKAFNDYLYNISPESILEADTIYTFSDILEKVQNSHHQLPKTALWLWIQRGVMQREVTVVLTEKSGQIIPEISLYSAQKAAKLEWAFTNELEGLQEFPEFPGILALIPSQIKAEDTKLIDMKNAATEHFINYYYLRYGLNRQEAVSQSEMFALFEILDNAFKKGQQDESIRDHVDEAFRAMRRAWTVSQDPDVLLSVMVLSFPNEKLRNIGWKNLPRGLRSRSVNIARQALKLLRTRFVPPPKEGDGLDRRGYHFQNFQHMMMVMAGQNPEVDGAKVLLASLVNRLTRIELDKTLTGDSLKRSVEHAIPLAERLGLRLLADGMRDVVFRRLNRENYKLLKDAIQQEFGMDYDDMENTLIDLQQDVESVLNNDRSLPPFHINSRVKSLSSLWNKLEKEAQQDGLLTLSQTDPTTIRQYFGDIDDILGLQIVFDLPRGEWQESRVIQIQNRFLVEIENKIFKEKLGVSDSITRKVKDVNYGYMEQKIKPRWSIGGIRYRGEIQVLSRPDYAIYRYGHKAHWAYKLQTQGHLFDMDILQGLTNQLSGDFFQDYKVMVDNIKDHVFIGVWFQKEGEDPHIRYLRLPRGSRPADAAASRIVNLLNEDYKGAITVRQQKLNENEGWDLSSLRRGEVIQGRILYNGDIIKFVDNREQDDEVNWSIIKSASMRFRTRFLASVVSGDLKIPEDREQAQISSRKWLEELIESDEFFKDWDVDELMSYIQQTAKKRFVLKDDNEFRDVLSVLDSSRENDTLHLFGIDPKAEKESPLNISSRARLAFQSATRKDTFSESLPGLATLFHLMKSFRGRDYPLRDAFFHYLLSGIVGRDMVASDLEEDTTSWRSFRDVENDDFIIAARLRDVVSRLQAENLEDLFVHLGTGFISQAQWKMAYLMSNEVVHRLKVKIQGEEEMESVAHDIMSDFDYLGVSYQQFPLNFESKDSHTEVLWEVATTPEKRRSIQRRISERLSTKGYKIERLSLRSAIQPLKTRITLEKNMKNKRNSLLVISTSLKSLGIKINSMNSVKGVPFFDISFPVNIEESTLLDLLWQQIQYTQNNTGIFPFGSRETMPRNTIRIEDLSVDYTGQAA